MAQRYIEAIRDIQPEGPYYVAGWSAGGHIALEMAQRWQNQGETVGLLGLFDTPARLGRSPSSDASAEEFWDRAPTLFADLVGEYLENLGLPILISVDELRQLDPEEQVERLLESYQRAGLTLPDELVRHARALPRLARVTLEADWEYQPTYYEGRVTVFRPAAEMGEAVAENRLLEEWKAAAAEVEVVVVSGGHRSMILRERNARELAGKIEECLKRADANGTVC
jgi:thioesterase domain-containing protein